MTSYQNETKNNAKNRNIFEFNRFFNFEITALNAHSFSCKLPNLCNSRARLIKLFTPDDKFNKTGSQPVSRPVEQVPLLRGLGVGQCPGGGG